MMREPFDTGRELLINALDRYMDEVFEARYDLRNGDAIDLYDKLKIELTVALNRVYSDMKYMVAQDMAKMVLDD